MFDMVLNMPVDYFVSIEIKMNIDTRRVSLKFVLYP